MFGDLCLQKTKNITLNILPNPLPKIYRGINMTTYDKAKLIGRTFIESINILFLMGKDLETRVQALEEKLNDDNGEQND